MRLRRVPLLLYAYLDENELAVLEAEYRERQACESIEAEEAHWLGVFAAMPSWMRDVHYSTHPWLNRPPGDGSRHQ